MPKVVSIEHVQLAMPAQSEDIAREFYQDLLGIPEVKKPENLAARGGVWFEQDSLKIHLGVEEDFAPALKAHPALIVEGLESLVQSLRNAGYEIKDAEPLVGWHRVRKRSIREQD